MSGEFIADLGTIIIALLGAIVTYIVIPYIKERTTKDQMENLMFWVKIAVGAAEQIYKDKGQGALKKEYVIKFLHDKGIKITEEQIDLLIEAAVFELNNFKRGLNTDQEVKELN